MTELPLACVIQVKEQGLHGERFSQDLFLIGLDDLCEEVKVGVERADGQARTDLKQLTV